MKLKCFVLLSLCLGLSCVACSSHHEEPQPEPTPEPEEYINPTPSTPEAPSEPGEEPKEPEVVEPVYDEQPDSVTSIDVNDMSGLYNAFNNFGDNYTSVIKGYFNEDGLYDYYRHYHKNYVCDKESYFTGDAQYTLPELEEYLPVCNTGYLNLGNDYYQFSLKGETKEARMSSSLTNEDLSNKVENKKYQDDLFTLNDLNQEYFEANEFTRISANKYQSTKREVCEQFVSICSPDLYNEGYYMTFQRVTIEVNPMEGVSLRVRLYTPYTQIGKLIDSHRDEENKPNWYLLFSEAYISNIGTTTFAPANELLK